jgi:hypothetical protein
VVLEHGAAWPQHAEQNLRVRGGVVVVVEQPLESDAKLWSRIFSKRAELVGNGARLETAVLVCSNRNPGERAGSRSRLLRKLAHLLADDEPVTLIITSDSAQSDTADVLTSLAGDLIEGERRIRLPVQVIYPQPAPTAAGPAPREPCSDPRQLWHTGCSSSPPVQP